MEHNVAQRLRSVNSVLFLSLFPIPPVEAGEALMLPPERRGGIELPEKDWPILGGAVASGATHLITGDQRHFAPYFGRQILEVWIVRPGDCLRERH